MDQAERTYHLARGAELRVGANRPLWLDQGPLAWVVLAGALDVFAVESAQGEPAGPRHHLLRAGPGQAVFGLDPAQCQAMRLLAVGVPGTSLAQVERRTLLDPDQPAERHRAAQAMLAAWVAGLYAGLGQDAAPRAQVNLAEGDPAGLEAGQVAIGPRRLVWVRAQQGQAALLGRPELVLPEQGYAPLPDGAWLRAMTDCALTTMDTAGLLAADPGLAALDHFHARLCALLQLMRDELLRRQTRQLATADAQARDALAGALARLAKVLGLERGPGLAAREGAPHLLTACRAVAQRLGIGLRTPPAGWDAGDPAEALARLARISRIRVRPVSLDQGWWTKDNGPLLAFAAADGRPLALLPESPRAYSLYDPQAGVTRRVERAQAAGLSPVAYMFYRPLPLRGLTTWQVVRFGARGLAADLWMVVLMGICGGLLGMVTPVATGMIFDSIIPSAERRQLWQMVLALAVVALTSSMLRLTRNLASLRVEGRMDAEVQAGVWDRLLSLPVPFFRGFTAGDLANRANGISAMRHIVSGAMLNSALTGVFSLFSFALLFYYDWALALVSSLVVLLAIAIAGVLGYLELACQRPLTDMQGKIAGLVLQIIAGMDKLHVAGAEERAFLAWASLFAAQKDLGFRASRLRNILSVANAGLPILGAGLIYYWMVFQGHGLSTGDFMAFTTAFGNFLSAMLAMTTTFMSVLQVVPLYRRAKPILDTLPEFDESTSDPGQLGGAIELSHLSFRYSPDGPLILNDVSLSVRPGQFVALVGPSGSGKSTLLRLLLGFEKPASGAVYYDGQDLADLDKQAVRRQIGVVLQSGKLTPGDIRSNIVGASNLSDDDAWAAAEAAGLAEDIRAMPMGMHTVVSEGSGTLSGGQAQRLLIARAIVRKPRLIFLDEATSALDNRVQAVVTGSMERLKATRVVIAHRLSTIQHADHIVVLAAGRVAEEGDYAQLMANDGLFAELARRQMA